MVEEMYKDITAVVRIEGETSEQFGVGVGHDLAVVADNKEDLQKSLQERNNTFRKHGLRMNLEKTEVMWIGEQEVDLHVAVDGKTIKQVNSFVYLGGSSKEIQRKVQAGAAAWKRVEGIICDIKLKKTTKRKSVRNLHGTSLYIRVRWEHWH